MNSYTIEITEIRKAKINFESEASTEDEALKEFEEKYWHNPVEYDSMLEPEETEFEVI